MFQPTGFAGSTLDPNMNRVIEELAHVINDVDQRLQLVKIGLVQGFPHLALSLGVNRSAYGNTLGVPTVPPAGVFAPYLGAPSWPTVPGIVPFGTPTILGAPGVTTPLTGLAAPFSPFRY